MVFVFSGVEPCTMMDPKDDLRCLNLHWSFSSPQRSMTECFAYFIDVDISSFAPGINRDFTGRLNALKVGMVVHSVHFELGIRRKEDGQGVRIWLGNHFSDYLA